MEEKIRCILTFKHITRGIGDEVAYLSMEELKQLTAGSIYNSKWGMAIIITLEVEPLEKALKNWLIRATEDWRDLRVRMDAKLLGREFPDEFQPYIAEKTKCPCGCCKRVLCVGQCLFDVGVMDGKYYLSFK